MGPVPPLKQVSLVWGGGEELSESSCQLVPPFQGLAPSARNTSPQDTGPPQTPPPVVSPQSESATCSRPPGRPGRMMQGHSGLDAAGGGGRVWAPWVEREAWPPRPCACLGDWAHQPPLTSQGQRPSPAWPGPEEAAGRGSLVLQPPLAQGAEPRGCMWGRGGGTREERRSSSSHS